MDGGGRSRAIAVVRRPSGEVLYFNDRVLALAYAAYERWSCAPAGDQLESRLDLAAAALDAHEALNAINGRPAHAPGMATKSAGDAGQLTKGEARALRSLRRKANDARHVWPDADANVGALCPTASRARPVSTSSSSDSSASPPPCRSSSTSSPAPSPSSSLQNAAVVGTEDFFIGEGSCSAAAQTTHTLENTLIISEDDFAAKYLVWAESASCGTQADLIGYVEDDFCAMLWGREVVSDWDYELSSEIMSIIDKECHQCLEANSNKFWQQVEGGQDMMDVQVGLERYMVAGACDALRDVGIERGIPIPSRLARFILARARRCLFDLASSPPCNAGLTDSVSSVASGSTVAPVPTCAKTKGKKGKRT